MGTKYGRKCFLIWRFAAEFNVGFRQSVQAMLGCGKDVACRFGQVADETLALPEDAGRIEYHLEPSGLSEGKPVRRAFPAAPGLDGCGTCLLVFPGPAGEFAVLVGCF